jgi:hypothetical protein
MNIELKFDTSTDFDFDDYHRIYYKEENDVLRETYARLLHVETKGIKRHLNYNIPDWSTFKG